MTNSSDDLSEMLPLHLLDETTVEALLNGGPVRPELEPLAEVVQEIRSAGDDPVEPTAQLAERIAAGQFADLAPAAIANRTAAHGVRSRLAAMTLRARAVTGAAVMFTGLTAATAAGALPDAAQERVESIIEAVSPITFPDRVAPDRPEVVDDVVDRVELPDQTGRGKERARAPADPGNPTGIGQPPADPGNRPTDHETPDKHRPDTPPGLPESPEGRPESPPEPRPDTPGGPPEVPGEKPENPATPQAPVGKPDGSDAGSPDARADKSERRSAKAPDPPRGKPETRPTGPKR